MGINTGFVKVLIPAGLGGAVWDGVGLPLGWLLGAAVISACFAFANVAIKIPPPLYFIALATLGASVGLAITPDVGAAMLQWAPLMGISACAGIAGAVLLMPLLKRFGNVSAATAYFALLPGGIIEMANIGTKFGADSTVISAVHAVRVGLVVALIPLALVMIDGMPAQAVADLPDQPVGGILLALAIGVLGGWLSARAGLPAAWLLGAVIAVGIAAMLDTFGPGGLPQALLAGVQIIVGISLGARYRRDQIAAIPRAMLVGCIVLLALMCFMALLAAITAPFTALSLTTLVLCFSIGGMAEMVLTSKALGANVAMVAAFQAVRGVLVNMLAGFVWKKLSKRHISETDPPKG